MEVSVTSKYFLLPILVELGICTRTRCVHAGLHAEDFTCSLSPCQKNAADVEKPPVTRGMQEANGRRPKPQNTAEAAEAEDM